MNRFKGWAIAGLGDPTITPEALDASLAIKRADNERMRREAIDYSWCDEFGKQIQIAAAQRLFDRRSKASRLGWKTRRCA